MNRALALAIQAIEATLEDRDAADLYNFCEAHGLSPEETQQLVEAQGSTSEGRVMAFFRQREADAPRPAEGAETPAGMGDDPAERDPGDDVTISEDDGNDDPE